MAIQPRTINIPPNSQTYSSDLPRSEITLQEWIEDLKMYRRYRHWLLMLKWLVIFGGAGIIGLLGYLFHMAYSDNRELSIRLEMTAAKMDDIDEIADKLKEDERQVQIIKDRLSESEKNIGILHVKVSGNK